MKKHHLKTQKHDHILNLVAKQPKKSTYVSERDEKTNKPRVMVHSTSTVQCSAGYKWNELHKKVFCLYYLQ